MAITGVAKVGQQGMGSTVRMTNQERIRISLDNSYPGTAGGYANFSDTVKSALGSKITVLDIQQAGPVNITTTFYNLVYNRATDRLMVLNANAHVANATDLSAIVNVELIVTYV